MQVDGACHCGAIAFSAEIDPERVSICHCTDCQTLTGTAFRLTVRCAESDFRLLRGTPKVYVKTAESGNKRVQAFCGDCGTPLYATTPEGAPDRVLGVRTGVMRQRDELVPNFQVWTRSALHWLPDLPGQAKPTQ